MTAGSVLVLSAGKSVGMILQLKEAMQHVPALKGGRILVADRAELTPAGCFADGSVVVPPIADAQYAPRLLEICREQGVRVLLPRIDLDLERLAPDVAVFAAIGATLACPPPDLVELGLDKRRFEAFAREEGLEHPRTYAPHELSEEMFPLFAKRRRGFGSVGSGVCRTLDEAHTALEQYPDLLFQPVIEAPEISVDGYISAEGRCIVRVPRIRDRILGGEAFQSHTIGYSAVSELADRTIAGLARRGLRGPLNVQIFATDPPTLIEVNTRLGAASVLSNQAVNGRYYAALLHEACGGVSTGDPDDYIVGMHLYRFFGDVFHDGTEALRIFPAPAHGVAG